MTLQVIRHHDLRSSRREAHGDFAHPHIDRNGEMITYVTRFSLRNTHRVVAIDPRTLKRRDLATLRVGREPEYMHSFCMTENYLVLIRQPLTYSLPSIVRSGKFQDGFRWHPERGTQFSVINRHTGRLHRSYTYSALFFWHQINAFEQDGDLVIDLIASDTPASVWDLDLVKLRNPAHRPAFHGEFRRYHLPLDGDQVTSETICAARMEFPQINYAFSGRDYRFAYAVGYSTSASDWFDEIVKMDTGDGSTERWSEAGCYPSEPMFARAPTGIAEDDGVILSVVLDSRSRRSFLLVLDAASFTELARAEVPHHIPFNFQQQYYA